MCRFLSSIVLLACLGLLVSTENPVNTMCPVFPDEPIDPTLMLPYNGQVIGFCCKKCIRKFRQDPSQYDVVYTADSETASNADHVHNVDSVSDSHDKQSEDHDSHQQGSASSEPDHAGGDDPTGHDHAGSDGSAGHDHDQHTPNQTHDHGSDGHSHGDDLLARLGRFHVILVHFPIGLILVAATLALGDRIKPNPPFRTTAVMLTHAGAVSTAIAALLGWATWTAASYPGAESALAWHQWLGTSAAAVAIIASWAAGCALTQPRRPRTWLITLVVGAALVGLAGHFGGTLIYGSDYLF